MLQSAGDVSLRSVETMSLNMSVSQLLIEFSCFVVLLEVLDSISYLH
jgi:hypothetical protein